MPLSRKELLITTKSKRMHGFLNYYPDGKRDVFEKKNNYIKYSGNIKPYKVSASRHSNHFKFKDAESLLNDFVNNLEVTLNLVAKLLWNEVS